MALVSVIMPVFNSSKHLHNSITSVLKQSFLNYEFIIYDDASTDNSLQIIKSYKDKRIILKVGDVNQGAGYARRESLRYARGEYVAFIDSDDIWYPEKLEKCVTFLESRDDIAAVQSNYVVTKNSQHMKIIRPKRLIFREDMMLKNHCAMSCMVLRSKEANGIEMPLIRARQDYAFWLKILERNKTFYTIDEILVEYQKVKGSVSSNPLKNVYYNYSMFRKELEYSRLQASRIVFKNILSKVFG